MGIISDIVKVARKLFIENQYVESDSRESLKEEIVRSGMSVEDGSILVQQLDQSVNSGKKFSKRQDDDVRITPADKDTLEEDSTIKEVKDGVHITSEKYSENENVKTVKDRERDE